MKAKVESIINIINREREPIPLLEFVKSGIVMVAKYYSRYVPPNPKETKRNVEGIKLERANHESFPYLLAHYLAAWKTYTNDVLNPHGNTNPENSDQKIDDKAITSRFFNQIKVEDKYCEIPNFPFFKRMFDSWSEIVENGDIITNNKRVELYVVKDESAIRNGTRGLLEIIKTFDDSGKLKKVYIDSLYVQKGYGKKVLEKLFAELDTDVEVTLSVASYKQGPIEFYKKLGFVFDPYYHKIENLMPIETDESSLVPNKTILWYKMILNWDSYTKPSNT